jgi:hypothetical protein
MNLKNSILNPKTYTQPNEERSEREHRDLIETANTGVKAIRTLQKKYGEQTIIVEQDGFRQTLSDEGEVEDISFEKK